MRRLTLPGLACALAGLFAGCGPMAAPLPARLDDETQKQIDESWHQAFTPPGRFDRQGLLDVLVGTHAYQVGVDVLTFRSEKRFAGGTAVMEVSYDRAKPEADRLTVTVSDLAGKVVRSERYTRAEVARTGEELARPAVEVNPEPPGQAARRADREVRWKRIEAVFPPAGK